MTFDDEGEWIHAHEYATTIAVAVVLVVALVLAFAWQRVKYERLQERAAALALAQSNAAADRDTTRAVAVRLADSLQAVQRLAVQTGAVRDSLDRALGLERKALSTATATIRTLTVTRTGPGSVRVDTVPGAGVRLAQRFVVDSAPYHVTAEVSLAPPPDSGRIALAVRVDPLTLETRVGCGPSNGDGIRPAAVTVVGPTWATLTLGRVEQTADVCRSPALEPAHGDGRPWWRRAIDRVGIAAGYGFTASGGTVHAGPTVLAGVKLWP